METFHSLLPPTISIDRHLPQPIATDNINGHLPQSIAADNICQWISPFVNYRSNRLLLRLLSRVWLIDVRPLMRVPAPGHVFFPHYCCTL